jgi:hypothetical protein
MLDSIDKNSSTRDVRIEQLKIVGSSGQTLALDFDFDTINIHEDLFAPVISGSMQIDDSGGKFAKLDLHGNEQLIISFTRPGVNEADAKYTKSFRIYKSTDRRPQQVSQSHRYILHFCSEELLFSNQVTLSRKLLGGNAAQYVLRICRKDLKINPKKLTPSNFERSTGATEFILTQYKPLEAIDYLAAHTYNDNESTFWFFENKDGFNFMSLEKMLNRDSIMTLKYNKAKVTQDQRTSAYANFDDITDFNFAKSFDVLDNTGKTSHNGRLFTLDLITQEYKKKDYSYVNEFSKHQLMDKDGWFPFNNATNRNDKTMYEEYGTEINYWLTNKENNNLQYFKDRSVRSMDTNIERTLLQRKAQMNMLRNTEIDVIVAGNPALTVGKMVEVELPAFTQEDENMRSIDPYYSGRYLITAVTHVLAGKTLQTKMRLAKNSVKSAFSPAFNDEQSKNARGY